MRGVRSKRGRRPQRREAADANISNRICNAGIAVFVEVDPSPADTAGAGERVDALRQDRDPIPLLAGRGGACLHVVNRSH